MKIMLIGSSQYLERMQYYKMLVEVNLGNEVRLPALDGDFRTELEIMHGNLDGIKWADEVHIFWDGRSTGFLLDFGMAVALEKPIRIIYLEQKSLRNLVEQYAKESGKTKAAFKRRDKMEFSKALQEAFKDPEVKREYDKLEAEFKGKREALLKGWLVFIPDASC